uniref:Ion transport domain-containing protein n=1 Tax=Biomphalaria glabrata TaxID=6526 RepID=A0A2C9KJR8_BIOGL
MDKVKWPTSDSVPLFVAMVFVVPIAFEFIRILLEDKLDFDLVINLKLLRIIELVMAIMIFPTAALSILGYIVYKILLVAFFMAIWLVDQISRPEILFTILYYVTCFFVLLALLIGLVVTLKYIANNA